MENEEILKLYYNLVQNEKIEYKKEEYFKLSKEYVSKADALNKLMGDKGEVYDAVTKLQELDVELHSLFSQQTFIKAFKMGFKLGVEVFGK